MFAIFEEAWPKTVILSTAAILKLSAAQSCRNSCRRSLAIGIAKLFVFSFKARGGVFQATISAV
jgi:hypothetical protein